MENSFSKDKSVGLVDTKKIMKFAMWVKLWQHNFTIATVVKFLTKGLCSESGLHSPLSRSFRCPLINTLKRLHVRYSEVGQKLIKPKKSAQKNYMISFLLDLKAPKEGVSGSSKG